MKLKTAGTVGCFVAALLAMAGCGTDGETGSDNTTASPSAAAPTSPTSPATAPTPRATTSAPAGLVIDVTVNGDEVSPNGKRIQAKINEPIILVVTADRAGELHVHSTPEQQLEYGVGKTTLTLTIDKPGIVEVEDHIAETVVVQLQVS